jgi:hypothetical protein
MFHVEQTAKLCHQIVSVKEERASLLRAKHAAGLDPKLTVMNDRIRPLDLSVGEIPREN